MPEPEGLDAMRGCLIGVALGALVWAAILLGLWAAHRL